MTRFGFGDIGNELGGSGASRLFLHLIRRYAPPSPQGEGFPAVKKNDTIGFLAFLSASVMRFFATLKNDTV
jgi:hypothetical protein